MAGNVPVVPNLGDNESQGLLMQMILLKHSVNFWAKYRTEQKCHPSLRVYDLT